jgi:hypothetical protein
VQTPHVQRQFDEVRTRDMREGRDFLEHERQTVDTGWTWQRHAWNTGWISLSFEHTTALT